MQHLVSTFVGPCLSSCFHDLQKGNAICLSSLSPSLSPAPLCCGRTCNVSFLFKVRETYCEMEYPDYEEDSVSG